MRVARRAITEVVPALDIRGDRVAQAGEFGEDVGFVGGGTVREVLFENQHFLANVPLDRKVPVRNRIDDPRQRGQQ